MAAAGEDTIRGGGGADNIAGGGRSDMISGGGRTDSLRGGGGDDTILGNGGDDLIDGGGGDDMLTGGRGADRFRASAGQDTITDFDLAADFLDYSRNEAVTSIADLTLTDDERGLIVEDGEGRRFILEGVGSESVSEANLIFTPFELPQTPAPAGRMLQGGAQDDELIGGAGPDTLLGGGGDDTLFGYAGDDHLNGQAVRTTFEELFDGDLFVEGALQQLFGGAGNDTLENALEFYGGDGDDLLRTTGSIDLSVSGGRGDDTFIVLGDEHELIGGEGADEFRFLTDGPSDDINILDFEPGVDSLFYAAGHGVTRRDHLLLRNVDEGLEIKDDAGGSAILFNVKRADFSFDDVFFENPSSAGTTIEPLPVDPTAPTTPGSSEPAGFALTGTADEDQIFGFRTDDIITGREGEDILEGREGDDLLFGGEGADFLTGGEGDDTLVGGPGGDFLDGGAGADTFLITETDTLDLDIITSFSISEDIIDFSENSLVNDPEDLAFSSFGTIAFLSFDNGSIELTLDTEDPALDDITFIF